MPRLKKKEEPSPPAEPTVTLTAGRSRRTIKPNRKYLNDSVVLATTSKTSSRDSSPDSDASEDDYRQMDEDDEEIIPPKSAAGRKSTGAATKKPGPAVAGARPRGRPPKGVTKTEPVKNLRKEVMKKMDLSMLNMGRARVVLTPINKDIKRKLDLDTSLVKGTDLLSFMFECVIVDEFKSLFKFCPWRVVPIGTQHACFLSRYSL